MYCILGYFGKAISDTLLLIKLAPNNFYYRLNLGLIYREQKEYISAIYEYNYIIDKDPQYELAYQNRGAAYQESGQYKEVLEDLDKAIELNPMNSECYCMRGYLYLLERQYDLALINYAMVIKLGVNDLPASQNIEIVLSCMENINELNGIPQHVLFNIIKTLPEETQGRFIVKFLNEDNYCLNGAQKNIIEGTLAFYFDTIAELDPKTAIKVLSGITSPIISQEDITLFEQKDVLDTINIIREILEHPCPQNCTTNYAYFGAPRDDNIIVYKNKNVEPEFEKKGMPWPYCPK